VQLRDAKARLSELVDAASKGEPVTITRHGNEVAMVEEKPKKSLVDLLMEFPGGEDLDLERDRRPPREIDL
jgi:antitoxin (DNA-binding transcriptional repressor) of toxin-antitoxin stability system